MNKEEKVELVFETLSKIAGFKIKPNKEFYIVRYSENFEYKEEFVYLIDEGLNLRYEKDDGSFGLSSYDYNTLSILKGDLQLEEIKEPLLTEEGRNFLRQFEFEMLKIDGLIFDELGFDGLEVSTYLYMFDENGAVLASAKLDNINVSFDGLEKGRIYSRAELELWIKKKK